MKKKRYSVDEKIQWIIEYMKEPYHFALSGVDILNADFVDAYIEKFNSKHEVTMWGANKCRDLVRVLKIGYDRGIFDRWTCGIQGMWGLGFPKWVYAYKIKEENGT